MQTERKRAMIACLDDASARRFTDLLEATGREVVGTADSVQALLPMLRDSRPHVLLSEAVLPGGDGVSLARTVASASLDRYPCILLVCTPGLRLPGSASLHDFGVALMDEPLTARDIANAVAMLEARATQLPLERDTRLRVLMDRLGLPTHPGREMLANAVALAWRDRSRLQNLRDRIYPDAAKPLGKTGAQAERAIRHAIDVAWRTGEIDEQQRIFGDTIDARRGRPTCGEMIAQLADILRWEG